MRRTIRLAATALLLTLAACQEEAAPPATPPPPPPAPVAAPAPAPPDPSATLDARRKALGDLISEHWEHTLRTQPEFASVLGDLRYNDKWSDLSEKAVYADLEVQKGYVGRLRAIDVGGFPEQERLNHALLLRQLELNLEAAKFEDWLMPVNQFSSPHLDMAELVSLLSFKTVKDYDDYIARLRTLPDVMRVVMENMNKGLNKGLMPPKILLTKVVQQASDIGGGPAEKSPFAAPLHAFPASIPAAEQARIRAAVLTAIGKDVDPAYGAFTAFVRGAYGPKGREEPGIWALPLGAERYAYDVKYRTTTALSADEIHAIGLREVDRIEAAMKDVAHKLGFEGLPALARAIEKDPKRHFSSRKDVLDRYQRYTDQMYPKLPSLFGRLPKAKLEIKPVEEFREKGAAAAQYYQGTPDGTRPGHVMVNTGSFAKRATPNVETTAYHEGVPGHHLQITIAQELQGLPPFRQQYEATAFIEGWALYAERLGEEVGFYQDPYSSYGHLQDEMLRAIRLVVDSGLHAKKWSRQQVVDFFHAHSTSDEVEVQSETDRYIAIPGQALAYKIGQLKILALRDKAKKALGDRFDIREFHDEILGGGSLPLDVLEDQVDRWIAGKKG